MALVFIMKLASLNLSTIDFERIEGVKTVFPIPMPIFAEKHNDDTYKIYSLVNRVQWAKDASLDIEIELDKKKSNPLFIDKELFESHFMPLGENLDENSNGVYGKVPKPVLALTVGIPCSYHSRTSRHLIEPNTVVVKTTSGSLSHYDENSFEQKFVDNIDLLKDMNVKVKKPEMIVSVELDDDNDFSM